MAEPTIAGVPDEADVWLRILIGYPIDSTFRVEADGEGIDLTDWTGTAHVKRAMSTDVQLELTVTPIDPQDGDDVGRFRIEAGDDDTDDLAPFVGEWDVRLIDTDGVPHRYFGGPALVERPVTLSEAS